MSNTSPFDLTGDIAVVTGGNAGRWRKSEEVAGTAVFLASGASQFVTGETIRVDGGYAIR